MNLTLTFADMFKRASLISCARLSRQSSLVPCRRPFKSTRVDTCESLWDIVSLKLIHCILTYRYMMIHVVNSISVSSWIFWIMSIGFYRSLAISCSTNIDPRPHQIHVFLKSLKCIPDWFKRGPVSERRDSYLCVDRSVRFRCPSCQVLKDVERCWKSRKKFAADLECEIFWDPGTRSRPNRCKALSARSGCELRDGSNLECLKRFDSIVYLDEMNSDPDESSRTI